MVPELKFMILRDFNNQTLTRIYYDNKTLKQNLIKLNDYHQICCQRSSNIKQNFTKYKILINICQYYKKTTSISSLTEIIISKKLLIHTKDNHVNSLTKIISEYSGIHYNSIQLAQPTRYDLYLDKGTDTGWYNKIKDTFRWSTPGFGKTKVTQYPWNLRDGDIILYQKYKRPAYVKYLPTPPPTI